MRTFLTSLALACLTLSLAAHADEPISEKHLLRYKFAKGDVLRWSTVHQGASTVKVRGHEQKSLATSKSTKVWKVTDVSDYGQITFVHSIDDVDMWQQVGDRAEERYNSKTDPKPPAVYEMVAATLGQAITEAVVNDRGEVIRREDKFAKLNLSEGDLITPLPEQAIAIGEKWHAPDELRIPVPGGVKRVKIRKEFTLEKVSAGVATISVSTQVLTPVNDPKAEAQLMQHITKGIIKFDVDAGRLLSRRLDWNETVLGFEGADSSMIYLARFTEELIPAAPRAAAKEGDAKIQ